MDDLSTYEQEMLLSWEEVHKKGQLTLWILLALKHGPKHMNEIKRFIEAHTSGRLSADDKSMYRALRRYDEADLVEYKNKAGKGGPDLKIYSLSKTGAVVLNAFIKRNIFDVFFKSEIKQLLEEV